MARKAKPKPPVKSENKRSLEADAVAISPEAGANAYAEARASGHKTDRRLQVIFVLAVILAAVYAFGLVVPKSMLDSVWYSVTGQGFTASLFVQQISENVNGILSVITGDTTGVYSYGNVMLRYIVVAVSGACMALSGAVYQGTFKNALVTPSTLGVGAGATLGMALWVVFFLADDGTNANLYTLTPDVTRPADWASYLWQSYGVALCSFAGCMLVVGVVLIVFRLVRERSLTGVMMIIVGQVVGAVAGALTGTIRYFYVATDPGGFKASVITQLQIASFYRSFTVIDVVALAVPLAVVAAVVLRYRQRLMLLSLDAAEARTLGVEGNRFRVGVIALCTLLTAITLSFVGSVGFVGFLVPHLARRLVGPNLSYLLPASMVLGAVFVLGSYVLVSMLFGPALETMCGMFISIGGAVVFLITALRGKGGARGSFN